MTEVMILKPGQRIYHAEFGEGVVVEVPRNGYIRAFFPVGERQVPLGAITNIISPIELVLSNVEGSEERLRDAWLAYEAHALQQIESAAALTSARIDLLPHQIVLTHRVATSSPRRFLIADEVGLGKTIETALILRELASRGELKRALMVVPAGLVNNWHRELNEVFNLDFEVFGSEGDVTDRKTNAFIKHDRLIASIDTLKRAARVKRLKEAPPWDLVVFDEAHHLTATKDGGKLKKTENYRLAEALRNHARDLMLLSATPHQGDHFRFWMLIQLLDPTLAKNAEDMVENRHRLNTVVIRRTKADACKPDGSPLFARRWVHTESFTMTEEERRFYQELRSYLEEGFALAKRRGTQGRALGFLMAIFQKIAASSFAAVKRTLRRRLLMLTIHDSIIKDENLDVEGRESLNAEARVLLHEEYGFPDDPVGRGEVDRTLADLKVRLLRKIQEEDLDLAADASSGEEAAQTGEDLAAMAINIALPEERKRIHLLLAVFPEHRETKVTKLLQGLGALWHENPKERVVIFATYLGTVELLQREIEQTYPGQGVVVLKGGDHGAKLAAERRFRRDNGPRVLVCTAAGREGINLQFARVLFNFDLPWNPMDVEQRIGRIHRYGQTHTAQVYNLVLSDTIEGRIFLLLDAKLKEIAKAVGKVDERGDIAEDLRSQILGQLSERIRYDRLYQEALSDPELKRTRLELETALRNATEARKVVFDLFQDLEGFSLEDYKPFEDVSTDLDRIVHFLQRGLDPQSFRLSKIDPSTFQVVDLRDDHLTRFTTDREGIKDRDDLDLLGLDHPLVQGLLSTWRSLPPYRLGISVKAGEEGKGVLTWWFIETQGRSGERRLHIRSVAVDDKGNRVPTLEKKGELIYQRRPQRPVYTTEERLSLLNDAIEPTLHRELIQKGIVPADGGYSAKLIGWVEFG